ncbi:GNAT family N-acetyltransferase [Streptomyces sp. B3I8]|jgi:ribosomal protein S18 acetylase RimI-like enzyme|uniref:GNAT family N-acetyltransferase n=1 Tax=Streptomyces sp. B3I8 TaxID=3042303 RepID=UPI0027868D8C|nr:GNAT family N-acetyltransferase [Streptomyces sp. B3I8]MDQ0790775.1 ribosomal protein S18 acetylase RimI-like enzyme [Streptomyces sp. B3I8]
MAITYEWRGDIDSASVEALHAEGFGHPPQDIDWLAQLRRHSLGWVSARDEGRLVGFVNVAWDGGVHAFILDTMVARDRRGHGIGAALVSAAAEGARSAKCEWLHVDFDDGLEPFYFDACGFKRTPAGLIGL